MTKRGPQRKCQIPCGPEKRMGSVMMLPVMMLPDSTVERGQERKSHICTQVLGLPLPGQGLKTSYFLCLSLLICKVALMTSIIWGY